MVEIRQCEQEDFEAVLGLLRQLWPDRELDREAMEGVFRHNLGLASQHYLCAVSGGEIVGFCSLGFRKSLWGQGFLGYVDELVVDASRRGMGIGGKLLQQAVELAKEAGCGKVELDTAFHREDAHRFYAREGFENRGFVFLRDI